MNYKKIVNFNSLELDLKVTLPCGVNIRFSGISCTQFGFENGFSFGYEISEKNVNRYQTIEFSIICFLNLVNDGWITLKNEWNSIPFGATHLSTHYN